MTNRDYLEDFRAGNRARLIVSLAAKEDEMTAEELTDILTSGYADKLGYRRALRHQNAPASLVKKLSKDGGFLHCKCLAYWWDEATSDEIHMAAKWMIENEPSSCDAAFYAQRPNVSEKTLRMLYNNCADEGYLWEALMLNPITPAVIKSNIQSRMNRTQIRELQNKIVELKGNTEQFKQTG